jgi:hypothetical protein
MKFGDILREFDIKKNNTHYQDRVIQRFISQDFFDVSSKNKFNYNDKLIIGKYRFPPEVKDEISKILIELEKPYYIGDPGTVYIIQLHIFDLKIQDVILNGDSHEQLKNKKIFFDANRLILLREHPVNLNLQTEQSLSEGINLVCFIVNNKLTTLTLLTSTNPDRIIQKNKRDFPLYKIVYIKDPYKELDAFMDVDKLREIPNDPPEDPIDDKSQISPEAPQLSDHDRRVLIYKQRMEKDRQNKENKWKFKK